MNPQDLEAGFAVGRVLVQTASHRCSSSPFVRNPRSGSRIFVCGTLSRVVGIHFGWLLLFIMMIHNTMIIII